MVYPADAILCVAWLLAPRTSEFALRDMSLDARAVDADAVRPSAPGIGIDTSTVEAGNDEIGARIGGQRRARGNGHLMQKNDVEQ